MARLSDRIGGAWPDWPPLGSATDPIHCVRACVRVGGGSFKLREQSADEDERKKITSYTQSATVYEKTV